MAFVTKMLGCKKDYNAFSEEERYQAYRMFLKRTGEKGKRIAATQTIQKWFGIGGGGGGDKKAKS